MPKDNQKTSVSVCRMCAVCRTRIDKSKLIRVTKTCDGKFCLDKTGKADGRGAYICNTTACIDKAIKTKAFNRSFKCQVPDEIYQKLKV
ncbi:MAG: YlxR family protein [Firmicutes bacterium]|nr:YlxR family protein [Bacillota bacterium]